MPYPIGDFCPVGYEGTADHCFTGKEDDVEVGLIYFGKRYYAPLLQRWISADPLAVHAPGEADLNLYAYVHGKVLVAVDPVGLQEAPEGESIPGGVAPGPTGGTPMEREVPTGGKTASPAPDSSGDWLHNLYSGIAQAFYKDNPSPIPSGEHLEGLRQLHQGADQEVMRGGTNFTTDFTKKGAATAAGIPVAAGAGALTVAYGPPLALAGGQQLALRLPTIAGVVHDYALAEAGLAGGGLAWKSVASETPPGAAATAEDAGEWFYRAMSQKEFKRVTDAGGLVTRSEGNSYVGVTRSLQYALSLASRKGGSGKYPVVVGFQVQKGTARALQGLGATHPSAAGAFPGRPAFTTGSSAVQLKLEANGVLSYGLGSSSTGLTLFNNAITSFQRF